MVYEKLNMYVHAHCHYYHIRPHLFSLDNYLYGDNVGGIEANADYDAYDYIDDSNNNNNAQFLREPSDDDYFADDASSNVDSRLVYDDYQSPNMAGTEEEQELYNNYFYNNNDDDDNNYEYDDGGSRGADSDDRNRLLSRLSAEYIPAQLEEAVDAGGGGGGGLGQLDEPADDDDDEGGDDTADLSNSKRVPQYVTKGTGMNKYSAFTVPLRHKSWIRLLQIYCSAQCVCVIVSIRVPIK